MTTDRADTHSVNQLASGQISADEAAQMLRPPAGPQSGTGKGTANLNGRWLHVRVTDLETGKQKANVRLRRAAHLGGSGHAHRRAVPPRDCGL